METDAAPGRGTRMPKVVKAGRWILFALLLVSAAVTLVGLPQMQKAVARGSWPPVALALPAGLLALFAAGYAAYRIALVRAGRYPAGKALVQIVLMAVVVGAAAGIVLLPPEPVREGYASDLSRPLRSTDAEVRALAAEVVRYRPRRQAIPYAPALVDLLEDVSPEVRRQARLSLTALAGKDVGGSGPDAAARWRQHFRR